MFVKIKFVLKEVKQHMDKKVQMCKEMLASRSNRVVAGVIVVGMGIGLGAGLIISGYMPLPA